MVEHCSNCGKEISMWKANYINNKIFCDKCRNDGSPKKLKIKEEKRERSFKEVINIVGWEYPITIFCFALVVIFSFYFRYNGFLEAYGDLLIFVARIFTFLMGMTFAWFLWAYYKNKYKN